MTMDVFTSIALNYLPKARILADSLKKAHPDWKFHLLVSDRVPSTMKYRVKFDKKLFDRVVWVDELKIKNLRSWIFKHTVVELCTAVKGIFLNQLVSEGAGKIIYIDPDIVIFNDLNDIEKMLEEHAILLTPHLINYSDNYQSIVENEIYGAMRHGIFNLGFIAINAQKDEGRQFAQWWEQRLMEFCYADYEKGLFTDQKWCDLIPSYFEDYHVIRNPGYNAASWNLDTRQISFSKGGKMLVNDNNPLYFYHFTGYDSGAGPQVIDRLTKDGHNPVVKEIWDWYSRELNKMGQSELGGLSCAFDYFDNGEKIKPEMRSIYRIREDLQNYYPDPYDTTRKDGGFLQWMITQAPKEIQVGTSHESSLSELKELQAKTYQEIILNEKSVGLGDYVPLASESYSSIESLVKLIALYLPQYHPILENDLWWGKGFTEWTNVARGVPQFPGHYQPHLPDELGFYDLRLEEVQYRQIELAKQYGIHGFAYYYYWFAGKRLLEMPLDRFLNKRDMAFPFCLVWANENWTRRWDGMENEILMQQVHTSETDIDFIKSVEPFLSDERYIRINGRPILIVYRIGLMPDPAQTAERWREYCVKNKLGEPYLIAAQTFGFEDPRTVGFDAAMQFPPHNQHHGAQFMINSEIKFTNPDFSSYVFSYPKTVEYKECNPEDAPYPLYKGIFPIWDSESRKPGKGTIFTGSTPQLYERWLRTICQWTIKHHPEEARFVFINAWNEWAEGAHLEPDRRYGYAYLQATMDTLKSLNK